MSESEFTRFLATFMGLATRYSGDGAIHQICMDWRHVAEVLAAGRDLYEYKNLCVWNKSNAGMGTFYRSKHELVFVFKVATPRTSTTLGWARRAAIGPTSGTTPSTPSRRGRMRSCARTHGEALCRW